jgi:sigma-E factor negative regulatory protein RseA
MEKISQLMDGELEGQECSVHLRRLAQDAGLAQSWSTYHLIRDVLRDEASCGYDLADRVRQRLEKEPTVIAPHTRLSARIARYTLPMAAAVAGVAVVGWLALSLRPQIESTGLIAKTNVEQVTKPVLPVPAPIVASADGQLNDYLLAHQDLSPSTAIQGFAPYIRTVSTRESDTPR